MHVSRAIFMKMMIDRKNIIVVVKYEVMYWLLIVIYKYI